ncbi:MAG: VOC family protein [Azospirillaceae bacterium]
MTITSFHHTSFTVSDVDRAAAWFIEHFGMERLGGGDYDFDYIKRQTGFADADLKIAVLGFPGQAGRPGRDVLELIEYRSPAGAPADTATNRPGNAHLCFAVEDIEAEHARLSAAGVEFRSTPNTVTFGVNAGAKAVYLVGPDDIRLELFQKRAGG